MSNKPLSKEIYDNCHYTSSLLTSYFNTVYKNKTNPLPGFSKQCIQLLINSGAGRLQRIVELSLFCLKLEYSKEKEEPFQDLCSVFIKMFFEYISCHAFSIKDMMNAFWDLIFETSRLFIKQDSQILLWWLCLYEETLTSYLHATPLKETAETKKYQSLTSLIITIVKSGSTLNSSYFNCGGIEKAIITLKELNVKNSDGGDFGNLFYYCKVCLQAISNKFYTCYKDKVIIYIILRICPHFYHLICTSLKFRPTYL